MANSIRINIKQLGLVKNSYVDLKPLVILSGESGLGKSYVAILLHYLYKLLEGARFQSFFDLHNWSYEALITENPDNGSFSFKTKLLFDWINQDIVEYMCQALGNPDLLIDVNVEIPIKKKAYTFNYKKVSIGLNGEEKEYIEFSVDKKNMLFPAGVKSIGSFGWSLLMQEVFRRDMFNDVETTQTFAMVPGRGALLNLPISFQERLKGNKDIYSEFLWDWEVVRSLPTVKNETNVLLQSLFSINGGSIEMDQDQRIVYHITEDREIPITAAASSIKELAPLYMLLDKYPANKLSILFEEPEAHLHPQKQIEMADFVVQAINSGTHMQITTHSDYFLRRLNDRISLYRINKLDTPCYLETIRKYEYSDLVLDPSLIGAYLLRKESDGSVRVVSQNLEKGIPYESFYDVIQKETRFSPHLQQVFLNLLESHA